MNICAACKAFKNCFASELNKQELNELESYIIQRNVAESGNIFEAGKSASAIYMVVEGKVKLKHTDSQIESVIIRLACEGECIGLESVLQSRNYLLSAKAYTATTVCAIKKKGIDRFIDVNKKVCGKMMTELQNTQERLFNYSMLMISGSALSKLAYAIVMLSDKNGEIAGQKEELAKTARIRRETASRLLRKLKTDRIIGMDDRKIFILNRIELERMTSAFKFS